MWELILASLCYVIHIRILIELMIPAAAHVFLILFIRHLEFLDIHCLRLVLANYVQVIVELGPVVKHEVRGIKSY